MDVEEGEMETVEKEIDVNVPVRLAYDQWTKYESFPRFMEGIEDVRRIDDKRLHWRASIAGNTEEWDAEVLEETPNERVSWRSTSGTLNGGTVTFREVGPATTRVTLQMLYEPEGILETIGDKLGFVSRRVEGDLGRFKDLVESRASELGTGTEPSLGGDTRTAAGPGVGDAPGMEGTDMGGRREGPVG
jgi:uncharacterized membrane protein